MFYDDTIAAISTAYGTGAIAIIRLSGSKSFKIVSRLFSGSARFEDLKSHTVSYGRIVDPLNLETVDEVMVVKLKGPNTFTREDTVEINCHGGMVVQKRILKLLVEYGARPAYPGEFTKRAFLNGRIDLSQAEAVIDIINSKTVLASREAVRQLEGDLSHELKDIRDRLISIIAHIEATVDFTEHDIDELTEKQLAGSLSDIQKRIGKLSSRFERGRILREGLKIVIVGRPNVGKSSLLNRLSGKNRAIVSDIPGTTRDSIEEIININGIPAVITDTAGIRETEDVLEKTGVERTHKEIGEADLLIVMLDASENINAEEENFLKSIEKIKHIIVINKMDLSKGVTGSELLKEKLFVEMSLKNNVGIEELESKITGMFEADSIISDKEVLITNIRHKKLIDEADDFIKGALHSYDEGMPLDIMTIDIRNAAESIGKITGESVEEEVLNQIFSRFCIGK